MPLEPTMPLETVVDITRKNKVHALLTLPARGYVEALDAAQQLLSRVFSAQTTTIQAAWRGRLSRKKTLEAVPPVVRGDLEIEAATKIQAVARRVWGLAPATPPPSPGRVAQLDGHLGATTGLISDRVAALEAAADEMGFI